MMKANVYMRVDMEVETFQSSLVSNSYVYAGRDVTSSLLRHKYPVFTSLRHWNQGLPRLLGPHRYYHTYLLILQLRLR